MKRLSALCAFSALFLATTFARAQPSTISPPLGGCFDEARQYCAGLIAPTAITGIRLKDGALVAGAFPVGGIGYAVHLWYPEWHTVTIGAAVATSLSTTSGIANTTSIAGILGFAKYAFVGTSLSIEPGVKWWYLLAGIDVISVYTGPQTATLRAMRKPKQEPTLDPVAASPAPAPLSPTPVPPAPVTPAPLPAKAAPVTIPVPATAL